LALDKVVFIVECVIIVGGAGSLDNTLNNPLHLKVSGCLDALHGSDFGMEVSYSVLSCLFLSFDFEQNVILIQLVLVIDVILLAIFRHQMVKTVTDFRVHIILEAKVIYVNDDVPLFSAV
jgi:hypothetical protein